VKHVQIGGVVTVVKQIGIGLYAVIAGTIKFGTNGGIMTDEISGSWDRHGELRVSRDPEDYTCSTHAKQNRKWRNIKWWQVSEAIKSGEIRDSHKKYCKLFVKDLDGYENPVGVVVNAVQGKVITIEWRRNKGDRGTK
jgi:hypothetical protein